MLQRWKDVGSRLSEHLLWTKKEIAIQNESKIKKLWRIVETLVKDVIRDIFYMFIFVSKLVK